VELVDLAQPIVGNLIEVKAGGRQQVCATRLSYTLPRICAKIYWTNMVTGLCSDTNRRYS